MTGVTKEVEDAINECLGTAVLASRYPEYTAKAEAAKTVLLAEIEKYGDERELMGYIERSKV